MRRPASRGTEWLRIPDGLHPVRDDRRPTCGRIGDRTPRRMGGTTGDECGSLPTSLSHLKLACDTKKEKAARKGG